MTIDAKAADGLAKWAHAQAAQIRSTATSMSPDRDTADRLEALGNLASAYAATLPREVEIEGWVLVWPDGTRGGFLFDTEEEALDNDQPERIAARLTGTAVIKPEV